MKAGIALAVLLVAMSLPESDDPVSVPTPTATPQQEPPDPGIVFVSNRDGFEDIYVIQPDGSDFRRVTVTEPVEGEQRFAGVPAWSPDRSQIVFASNRDDGGAANLYVVNADGTNLRRLTDHDGFDYTPDWSPDGSTIAFVSDRDGFWELYAMDPDGSNVRRLTHLERPPERLCCPDWSPDGRTLVFMSRFWIGVAQRIVTLPPMITVTQVLDVATGQVTDLRYGAALARWSPDGEWLAYWGPGRQVWVMRKDGSESRQVSSVEGAANYPAWSPDGRRIVFNRLPGAGGFDAAELYVVNADGTGQRQLTDNKAMEVHANWW